MRQMVLVISVMLVPIVSSADEEIKCNPEGTQPELNVCAKDDFDQADKELNQTYQALINAHADNALFISKLRNAKKAWLAFRDADLEARFACAEQDVRICSGSMYPMSFFGHKAELTRERTRQLQHFMGDRS